MSEQAPPTVFRLQCSICGEKSTGFAAIPLTPGEELILNVFRQQHDRTCRAPKLKKIQPLAQCGAFGSEKKPPKSMRKPHGHVEITAPYGEVLHLDTNSCVHCFAHWEVRIGDADRHFCQNCNGYVCGPRCLECRPKELRLENLEAGIHEMTPAAPSILVPASHLFVPEASDEC